jgi:hypothetical protein
LLAFVRRLIELKDEAQKIEKKNMLEALNLDLEPEMPAMIPLDSTLAPLTDRKKS